MLAKPYSSEQMAFGATSGTGKLLTSVCWLGPLMAFKSQRFNREKTTPNVYSHLRSLLFAYNCFLSQHVPSSATLITAMRPNAVQGVLANKSSDALKSCGHVLWQRRGPWGHRSRGLILERSTAKKKRQVKTGDHPPFFFFT